MSTQEKLGVQPLTKDFGRSRFYKKRMYSNAASNKLSGNFHGRIGQVHISPKTDTVVGNIKAEPNDRIMIEISGEDAVRLSRIAKSIYLPSNSDKKSKIRKQKYRFYDHLVPLSNGAVTSVGAGIAVFSTMPSMPVLALGAAVVAAVVGYTLTDEMPDE